MAVTKARDPMSANDRLRTVYFAQRDALKRYLVGLCRDDTIADDILQDIYVRLSEKDVHGDIGQPLAYLFRMGSHLWLNRIRANANRNRRDGDWQALNPQGDGEEDAAPDAESVVAARQQLKAALDALDELPSRPREVFRMHKLQGLSHGEVARALGVSVSAVEKHVSTAMRHIRDHVRWRRPH